MKRQRPLRLGLLSKLILFLARMPTHVCINDVTISPTFNRGYVGAARAIPD